MKKINNLDLVPKVSEKAATIPGTLLALMPLFVGIALLTAEVFPSAGLIWWQVLIGETFLCAILLVTLKTRARHLVLPGCCLILLLLCVICGKLVLGSAGYYLNDVLDALTAVTGKIYLDFEESGSLLWFGIPVLTALCLILVFAVYRGYSWLLGIPAVLVAVCAFGGLIPIGWGCTITALGLLLAALNAGASRLKPALIQMTAAVVCIAIALGIAIGYKSAPGEKVWMTLKQKWHETRYHDDPGAMPEGELTDLGPLEASDDPAISLAMEEPQAVYLKGKVYEIYTGGSWERLDNAWKAEYSDLFYWLHQDDFFGQGSLAFAFDCLQEGTRQSIALTNMGACRSGGFIPYGLATLEGLDSMAIGDTDQDEVSVMIIQNGSLADYYALQNDLAARQTESAASSYLRLERAYAEYVYDVDLQITPDAWQVLERQLGTVEGSHSLSEILQTVQQYLDENLTYDETVYTLNGEDDFLHYVLERSGMGYSVQYATAATLMLRYFGVPARYVEGYHLSEEDAAALASGETVVLTEDNAHAWAEFYLNGIGFVPFEVTPGFAKQAQLPENNQDSTQESESDGNTATELEQLQQYEAPDAPEPADQTEDQRELNWDGVFHFFQTARMFPVYLLLILLLALIAYILIRRLLLRKALLMIEKSDNRTAVQLRYSYAMALYDRCEAELPEAETASLINQEAMFSNHEITQKQRYWMDEFALSVRDLCHEKWTIWQKIRYRWIEFID